jgi:hypothetical protein
VAAAPPAEAALEPEAIPLALAPPAADPEPAVALAPQPEAAPAAVPAEPRKVDRAPRTATRTPVSEPAPRPFASAAEMRAAFDDTLAFEHGRAADAAIRRWKEFRARRPSRELDEQARRRITELSLAQLKRIE